jgi:mannose/fructose/N-acetylgalactosamine-specific phosphotransferase system component IID
MAAPARVGPESDVTDPLNELLDMMAWLVSAACVVGLLIVGARMAISLRSGNGEEHLTQFATVMGACIIGATAGPVVTFLLE